MPQIETCLKLMRLKVIGVLIMNTSLVLEILSIDSVAVDTGRENGEREV